MHLLHACISSTSSIISHFWHLFFVLTSLTLRSVLITAATAEWITSTTDLFKIGGRSLGVSGGYRVPRDTSHLPHPSSGGTRGYSLSERLRMLQYWGNDLPVPPSMLQSIRRWSKERVVPYRMTGNKGAPKLSGEHLLLLVLFKLGQSEAFLVHCVTFIEMHLEDAVILKE